jgi:hypothetical protein
MGIGFKQCHKGQKNGPVMGQNNRQRLWTKMRAKFRLKWALVFNNTAKGKTKMGQQRAKRWVTWLFFFFFFFTKKKNNKKILFVDYRKLGYRLC